MNTRHGAKWPESVLCLHKFRQSANKYAAPALRMARKSGQSDKGWRRHGLCHNLAIPIRVGASLAVSLSHTQAAANPRKTRVTTAFPCRCVSLRSLPYQCRRRFGMECACAGVIHSARSGIDKMRLIAACATDELLECSAVLSQIMPVASQSFPLFSAKICGHLPSQPRDSEKMFFERMDDLRIVRVNMRD